MCNRCGCFHSPPLTTILPPRTPPRMAVATPCAPYGRMPLRSHASLARLRYSAMRYHWLREEAVELAIPLVEVDRPFKPHRANNNNYAWGGGGGVPTSSSTAGPAAAAQLVRHPSRRTVRLTAEA